MPCYEVLSASDTAGDGVEEKEVLCDKPCQALRACGRHQCRRVCCPLASLAMTTGKKGKRRMMEDAHAQGIGEEQGGWHECDLVCGKMLSCGNHKCEQRDHRGVCRPCLRSSFEELICFCGRTVYEPPIPCGTKIQCHYPCPRSAPPCGHPATPHSCHDDTVSCPPCPYLADKTCACGKKVVSNVRCSLETEKVSCGTVCGKLMACGFHHCERLCHGDECGACTAQCGKSRKSCLPNHHPCTRPCHAPATCPETEPCQSIITLTCSCGRIRQAVQCGRTATSSSSSSSSAAPKCTSECQIAKRNARLADALGINMDGRDKPGTAATYADDVVAFARANMKFLPIVERAFADFVTSEKKTQVLPHMPPDRRKFVHDLAAVYRMDTQMVDQEPHRSVQLLRRVDTRIPSPVLSQYISSHAPPPSLGKLADFRSLKTASATPSNASSAAAAAAAASWRSNATPKPATPPSTHRGWTSVVSKPAGAGAGGAPAAASTSGWGAQVANPRPTASLVGTTTSAPQSKSGTPRAVSPAVASGAGSGTNANEPVPDDWEDDA
ncbi:FKBP12-associated protein 1-like protein [Psilocybe cubensis]|nr:FKBP12-associated protein 1-like protein [Psilocybe cubensis]KAH9477552.1 FKBP12-associated protein 1-like protein [Psilocybe cubensis]